MTKIAVELVRNKKSLGVFNRLFLVPKSNNKWRPILDLSKLNLLLKAEKFKMETSETIKTSLRSHQVCLQHTQDLVKMCQQLGWLVNLEKSELEPKQVFDFVGCQFDLRSDRHWTVGRTFKKRYTAIPTGLPGPAIHVLDRSANSYRKTSSPRPTAYETHAVTFQLESTRTTRKDHSNSQFPALPSNMVVKRQCTHRPTITANKTCPANIYRRIKRRVGRSLR